MPAAGGGAIRQSANELRGVACALEPTGPLSEQTRRRTRNPGRALPGAFDRYGRGAAWDSESRWRVRSPRSLIPERPGGVHSRDAKVALLLTQSSLSGI